MAACQAEEDATTTPEDTTNQDATATTAASSTPKPETLTTLSAWGDNRFSALGDGTYGNRRTTPVKVSNLEGAELKAISAGGFHSLALKNDGTVLAWGYNASGQLGNGTNTNSTAPVQVEDPNDSSGYLTGVNAIAAGSNHSLALKSDGSVLAWGDNQGGQLGNGTNANSTAPVRVGDLDGVEVIAASFLYSLVLKGDGTVWAWGFNTSGQAFRISGQLGNDEISSSNTPVEVGDLPGDVVVISAGASHGLVLKDDGTVWAWGDNEQGQLGNDELNSSNTSSSSTPVQVSDLDGVKAIDGGGSYSLALKNDGTVWAWGSNQFGQLGIGTYGNGRTMPVAVSNLEGAELKAISAGGAHGLVLKDDGTVWAWGFNQYGQLGDGTNVVGNNTPVQVRDLSGVKAIAAGSDHSLAGG